MNTLLARHISNATLSSRTYETGLWTTRKRYESLRWDATRRAKQLATLATTLSTKVLLPRAFNKSLQSHWTLYNILSRYSVVTYAIFYRDLLKAVVRTPHSLPHLKVEPRPVQQLPETEGWLHSVTSALPRYSYTACNTRSAQQD
jgi:hypothetical protein